MAEGNISEGSRGQSAEDIAARISGRPSTAQTEKPISGTVTAEGQKANPDQAAGKLEPKPAATDPAASATPPNTQTNGQPADPKTVAEEPKKEEPVAEPEIKLASASPSTPEEWQSAHEEVSERYRESTQENQAYRDLFAGLLAKTREQGWEPYFDPQTKELGIRALANYVEPAVPKHEEVWASLTDQERELAVDDPRKFAELVMDRTMAKQDRRIQPTIVVREPEEYRPDEAAIKSAQDWARGMKNPDGKPIFPDYEKLEGTAEKPGPMLKVFRSLSKETQRALLRNPREMVELCYRVVQGFVAQRANGSGMAGQQQENKQTATMPPGELSGNAIAGVMPAPGSRAELASQIAGQISGRVQRIAKQQLPA